MTKKAERDQERAISSPKEAAKPEQTRDFKPV